MKSASVYQELCSAIYCWGLLGWSHTLINLGNDNGKWRNISLLLRTEVSQTKTETFKFSRDFLNIKLNFEILKLYNYLDEIIKKNWF